MATNAILVIARNFPWCPEYDEGSFGGRLHEDGVWSWEEYWLLEWALCQLCGASPERELHWRVFRVFSYCFALLSAHRDPNDGFVIRDLNLDAFYEARERFQLVFEGFFRGSMPSQNCFEQCNPLLIESRG